VSLFTQFERKEQPRAIEHRTDINDTMFLTDRDPIYVVSLPFCDLGNHLALTTRSLSAVGSNVHCSSLHTSYQNLSQEQTGR
jgi:hypothetical protein